MATGGLTEVVRDGTVTVVVFGPRCVQIEEPLIEALSKEIFDSIQGASPPRVVLDMSAVEFFGSSFIEVLFRSWNRLQSQAGGRMCLAGLRPYCREVLEITHLDKLWPLFATRDEAVAAASRPV